LHYFRSGKKVFKYIGIGIGVVLCGEICILITAGGNKYSPKYSFSSPSDYTDLFSDSARHKVSLRVTNLIRGRNPISEYVYDDRISIVVYKINVDASAVLDSILVQGFDFARRGLFKRYCALTAGQIKMSYACDSIDSVKKIIVSFYGDSLSRIFKNRNLVSVKMLLDKVGIQYEKNGRTDLEVEEYRPKGNKISIELTLLKHGDAVYFILISPTFNSNVDITDFSRTILDKKLFR